MNLKKLWLENIRFKYGLGNTYYAYENDIDSFMTFLITSGEGEIRPQQNGGQNEGEGEGQNNQTQESDIQELIKQGNIRQIRSWLAWLKMKNFSSTTIARKLSAVRSFYKFLNRNNYQIDQAIFTLKTPRKPKSIPKSMTIDQIEKTLESTEHTNEEKWVSARNRAIIMLAFCQGLRISEILSLTKLQLEQDYIRIKGKGAKERILPWLEAAKISVKDYLSSISFDLANEDPIFRGVKGSILCRTYVNKILNQLSDRFNLPSHISPHAFRHSFATHLLENGADLRVIGELLGHASLSTTQIYTKTNMAHLRLAHSKAFNTKSHLS